jgi:hypothetical protein
MAESQKPGFTRRQLVASATSATLVLSGWVGASGQNTAIFSVGLFVDVAAPTIPSGIQVVRTEGYHAPGEGSAEYVQDDIDDDYFRRHRSSAFAAADGRRFRLRTDTAVDPRSLGLRLGLANGFAKANRQAMLDALELGDTLLLPAGDIDLVGAGAISLPARDGLVVAGQGWTTRLVASDSAFMLPTMSRLEIRDLWIEQVATGNAAIQSFHANLRDIRLLRLKITMRDQAKCHNNCIWLVVDNSPSGADGVVGLKGLLVENCWLAPGRMGIEIQNHRPGDDKRKIYGYRDIIMRGCTVWKAPAHAGMGISMTGWGTDCLISKNRFVACHGPNVEIVGGDRTRVEDNVFEDAIGSPVSVSNFRVVRGCQILRNRTTGKPPRIVLYLQAIDGAEVAGNTLSTTGVAIIKGQNVRIHDNVFTGIGTGALMHLDNARMIMVEKNRFVSIGAVPNPQATIIAFNDTRDCVIRFNRMERADYNVRRDDLWFVQAPPARGSVVYGNERQGQGGRWVEPARQRTGT